jgi:hypothetical protein
MTSDFEKQGMERKDRLTIKVLEAIDEKLARIIELLEAQGRVRPS